MKHTFKPSEEDKDFCEICGKNFRNTDYHMTYSEAFPTLLNSEQEDKRSVATKMPKEQNDDKIINNK